MPDPVTTDHLEHRAAALRPAGGGAFLRAWLPFAACIAIAVVLQLVVKPLIGRHLDDFYSKLLLDIGTNIILAVSLTIVNGFTGQFSIGHAAFMAVGAYTAADIVYYGSYRIWGDASLHSGILSTMIGRDGDPLVGWGDLLFLVSILAGGCTAAICGYLVGLPSLRLRGDYLAIVTLGFGEIVRVIIQQTGDVIYDADEIARTSVVKLSVAVGGALGFSGLPPYGSLFWAWLFAGITLLVAYRLKVSSYGRAFLSIREDEVAAEAMGIHTTKYKVRAFVIAAFFAGTAGAIFAHTLGIQLNPGELGFQKSFDIIIMVVLGGMGSISGASIAAVILTLLPEMLRKPPALVPWLSWLVIPIVLALGYLILAPKGRRRDGFAVGFGGAAAAAAITIIAAWITNGPGREPLIPQWLGTWWSVAWMAGLGLVALIAGRRLRARVGAVVVFGLVLAGWEIVRYAALRNNINLADYRMVLYALALILMMILRPQGLLGVREVWELKRRERAVP